MLLTIDIGNTNITLGLYDGKELGPRWRLATAFDHMPDEYGLQLLGLIEHVGHTAASIDGICLASVVPPITSKIIEACRRYLNLEPLVVDAGVKTGVRVRYEDHSCCGRRPYCGRSRGGALVWCSCLCGGFWHRHHLRCYL